MRSAGVLLLAFVACAPPVVRGDPPPVPPPEPWQEPHAATEVVLETPAEQTPAEEPCPVQEEVPPLVEVPDEEVLPPLAGNALDLVLAYARRYVGTRSHPDCSNFVRDTFLELGLDLFASDAPDGANGVALVQRFVAQHGRNHATLVAPGDLVYFDDTWDKNRNGRIDDPLTHVGVVESIEPDGTIHVIHRSSRGVVRDPMNLARPADPRDETGRPINAYLRSPSAPGTRRLMGELFAGFGRVRAPGTLTNR